MNDKRSYPQQWDLLSPPQQEAPLQLISGKGAALFDIHGNKYINMFELSSCLGEENKTFNKYIHAALKTVNSHHGADNLYKRQLIHQLMATTDNNFNCVFLASSGSEAIEWAVKAAKKLTGRTEVICFWNSIHGRTHFSASMSGLPKRKTGYGPMEPGIVFSPYPDCRKCPFRCEPTSCGFHCIHYLEQQITYESTGDIAAILIEPYQGALNLFPPEGYLEALASFAKERGILLIFDEIQSGMGRTGSMYYYQQCGVVPDMLVLGKALGNGTHIAGFLSNQRPQPQDIPAMLGGSGDQVLSCAGACAVFDALLNDGYLDNIKNTGAYLKSRLLALMMDCSAIVEVRGVGLALAVVFDSPQKALRINNALKQQRVLSVCVQDTITLKPPFCLTQAQARYVSDALANAIRSV